MPTPIPPPLLCLLLAGAARLAGAQAAADTTAYATPALGTLVDAAARDNRVPPGLVAYRAAVESEIALAVRRGDGIEAVVAIEQVASTLQWTRTGYYDQHVVGYRARRAVPTASVLTMLPTGWVAPLLYGQRLLPPRPPADSVRGGRRMRGTPTIAIHPLASDRARYYHFSRGDTVATLRVGAAASGARTIPIVRIHVEPRADAPLTPSSDLSLFLGDMDIDAERHVVVRMRGQYVIASGVRAGGLRGRLLRAALHGYAFVDYEAAEHEGRFWLPSAQRLEFQVSVPALGDARAVLRVISRLGDVALNDTTIASLASGAVDTAPARPARWWRITRAAGDTLRRFDDWREALGDATGTLHADDFDDVAPDAWRRVGPPRVELYTARSSDLARFDRVEGVFTGIGGRIRFRDAAPGLTLRAAGGWAWAERTARGRVELERELGVQRMDSATARWSVGVRAGRSLDLTNDFRNPLDSGSSVAALLGSYDPYDYVDRRVASLFARGTLGTRRVALRLELGVASDRGASAHVSRGLIAGPDPFRPNRGVQAGRYVRSAVTVDLRPDVAAELVRPGIGARLFYERGDGDLAFQRAELRLVARRELAMPWPGALRGSTLTAVGRGDVGALWSDAPPPQQLFEIGGEASLYGYDYKTFAGDRASVVRASLVYGSPWWRAPLRVGRVAIPGVSPGLSAGIESGWTRASSAATLQSIAWLGPRDVEGSLSRPSGGVRTTINVGARLFDGALFVGAARPLDRHDDRPRAWRRVVGVGVVM